MGDKVSNMRKAAAQSKTSSAVGNAAKALGGALLYGMTFGTVKVGKKSAAKARAQIAEISRMEARANALSSIQAKQSGGSAALSIRGVRAAQTRGLTSKSQNRSDYRNGLLELAGGQRINNANANPASRARERVRMSIEAAPLNRGLSASQKSDYAKATQAHKAAAEKRASSKHASDGMTDAYVRTQNGKTVQVGGYRTVLPK